MRYWHLVLVVLLLAACNSGEQQRLQLEELERQNRADSLMLNDSLARDLADWFDRHGTRNEQMRAHYILGRTYADRGESPAALDAYHEAISRADTTAQDCDFAKLSRVYGQSAAIFYQQGLYRNAIEYNDQSSYYGWRGKDTLNALLSYGHKAENYAKLHLLDSAIYIYEDVIRQLKENHYCQIGAGFSCVLAKKLIDNERTDGLDVLFADYEQNSGFFDQHNNIESGREIYYYAKGLYLLNRSQQDSAEYYFRKELRTGKDFNNQSAAARGLALLYKERDCQDSVGKYALYYAEMNDSVYAKSATEEVERVKGMYDYSRQQHIAQQERQKADASQRMIWYIVICIYFVAVVIARIFYRQAKEKEKQREEHEKLLNVHISLQAEVMQLRSHKENYDRLLHEKEHLDEQLGATQTEIEELQTTKTQLDVLIAQKEDELEQQEADLKLYKKIKEDHEETEKQLQDSSVYKLLSEKANRGTVLTDTEWRQIERYIIDNMPEFYRFVSSREHALTTRMFRICILTRLQFPNKAIGCMMGVSAPSISQTRPIIFKKLFVENENGKDLAEKLQLFY